MKCDTCKGPITETFLEKFQGTYIGRGKKKQLICASCQKQRAQEQKKPSSLPKKR